MPTIYELFGKPVVLDTESDIAERKAACCPFTGNRCDGGGNRHQTKIKLSQDVELRKYFDASVDTVIPGICSIDYGSEAWVVCPRRLLGFKNDEASIPEVNKSLQEHERKLLLETKLPQNTDIAIWPEVYLRYGDEEENSLINYHFDFIAAPIRRDVLIDQVFEEYEIDSDEEKSLFIKCARIGKLVEGKYSPKMTLKVLPDLSSPTIIEVMTASTSGSDTSAGTNISSAFRNAILAQPHQSPGINKRQVWGRMATQLFAKTALAESWGGETFWVVQDQLLENIELTTKLSFGENWNDGGATINFISMSYDHPEQRSSDIFLQKVSRISAGMCFAGNNSAVDILLPKTNPNKKELLKAMMRRSIAAIVNLQQTTASD